MVGSRAIYSYDIADVNIDVQIIEEDEESDQMDVLLAMLEGSCCGKSILLQQSGLQVVLVMLTVLQCQIPSRWIETPPGKLP